MGKHQRSRKHIPPGPVDQIGSGASDEGRTVMPVTVQQKRMLFWGLGILVVLVLMNVAWAQIAAGLGQCFK
jgi:hypothetical protein